MANKLTNLTEEEWYALVGKICWSYLTDGVPIRSIKTKSTTGLPVWYTLNTEGMPDDLILIPFGVAVEGETIHVFFTVEYKPDSQKFTFVPAPFPQYQPTPPSPGEPPFPSRDPGFWKLKTDSNTKEE